MKGLSDADRTRLFTEVGKLAEEYENERRAIREVGESYGIDEERLRGMYRRMKKNNGAIHGNRRFSAVEEAALVSVAQGFSLQSRGLQTPTFTNAVALQDPQLSLGAARARARRMVARNADVLVMKQTKGLKKQRADQQTLTEIERFIAFYQGLQEKKNITPASLINADETRCTVHGETRKTSTIHAKQKKMPTVLDMTKAKAGSYTVFAAADGTVYMDAYTLPKTADGEGHAPPLPPAMARDVKTRREHDTYFMHTETGYVNGEIFNLMLQLLAPSSQPASQVAKIKY